MTLVDPKTIPATEWTADLLAKSDDKVSTETPFGTIHGRRTPNGTQVFLSASPDLTALH